MDQFESYDLLENLIYGRLVDKLYDVKYMINIGVLEYFRVLCDRINMWLILVLVSLKRNICPS